MYKYEISTYDYESSTSEILLHEKLFQQIEFDEMAAECFALAIKKDWDKYQSEDYGFTYKDTDGIGIDSLLGDVTEIMISKYGFIMEPYIAPVATFRPYYFLGRDSTSYSTQLIYNHIDKLLET